ncbi:MAG: type IX secretion system membrane protein PorP/SprF [Elusimicrobiota bacterium]
MKNTLLGVNILKIIRMMIVFILPSSIFLLPSVIEGAFKDSGWGARPLGMGGAFTAVADDSNAPLFNPAGISLAGRIEVTFMSAKLFAGLEGVEVGQNFFSCIYPLGGKRGDMALSWSSLNSPALYREDSLALSYSRYLQKADNINFSLGANFKYLNHEYTLDKRTLNDPVFRSKNAAGNFGLDLGVLAVWPENGFSMGVMSKNINQPDIGIKTEDLVPNENALGFSFYQEKMRNPSLEYFTFAIDLVSRLKDLDVRAGAESWFFNGSFAVRLGYATHSVTSGLGYEFKAGGNTSFVIDYAFAWPLEIEKTVGTHRMGLTLRLP